MSERTAEFQQLVDLYSRHIAPSHSKKPPLGANSSKGRSEFHDAASDIAKGIHRTSGVLQRLTGLVKHQGLFDDSSDEINSLIHRIKQDLTELNAKCDTAQKFVNSTKRSDTNQNSSYNVKVVDQLKSELMTATKDFKTVLEVRSSKMKDQQQRKIELTGQSTLSPMKSFHSSSTPNSANGKNNSGSSSSSMTINGSGGMQFTGNVSGGAMFRNPYEVLQQAKDSNDNSNNNVSSGHWQEQQQQQQLLLPPVNAQYYESREEAVTEVERTIGELGVLFKRLASMISEQAELVERIDEDVETAVSNADSAHSLLLRAYESASSNRGMFLKLAAILGAFFLFFVIFLM